MIRRCDKGLPVTIEKYSGDTPGIYVDEEGNRRIIEHNTVINSHMAGIFFHWAPSNVVRNNTLYGNRKYQILLSGKNSDGKVLENDELSHNIMFATDAEQQTLSIGINYNDVQFGHSDHNYFYNPHYPRHVSVSRYDAKANRWIREKLTLKGWRASSGYDKNSKEFSYLDQVDDVTIDRRRKSRIVYNASLDVASIELESEKYCNVQGNKIYGSISLQPFESMILIPSDFEIPDPHSQQRR